MKGKGIIAAVVVATVAGGAFAYRKGIEKLLFSLDGFELAPDGVNILVRIRVWNPNRFFAYPVPRMIVNAFDSNGEFVGTIINDQLQSIPSNRESFIFGYVAPSWENLARIIANIITSGIMPNNLVFQGQVQVGPVAVPFNTTQALPGLGCGLEVYDPMLPLPGEGFYPMLAGVEDLPEEVHIREGTILYTNWGYEQTNVDFYKVVSIGKKFFTVEKLDTISREGQSFMTSYVMPGESTGERFRGSYKVWPSGEPSYKIEGHYAAIWDGQEKYATHYA